MVLNRWLCVLGLALVGAGLPAGCNQSLFDNHGGGSGGGGGGDDDAGTDGPVVPSACPAGCIGDAAADFAAPGKPWRYLEELDHWTWKPMAGDAGGMTGATPGNRITACANNRNAEACRMLPGALLVSSAPAGSPEPVIEFTAPANAVLQLSVRAYLPAGGDQRIKLYRGSREDALFTRVATAKAPVEQTIMLDALQGDRFLVAIEPMATGATDVGLQLYINTPSGASFPSTCQFALPFTSANGNTTTDPCRGSTVTYLNFANPAAQQPVSIAAGPFAEQHGAAKIGPGNYFLRDATYLLDWSHDVTVQFWFQLDTLDAVNLSWLFADKDEDLCGGIGIFIARGAGNPRLFLDGCTDPINKTLSTNGIDYGVDNNWHFYRAVYTRNQFSLCVDGRSLTPPLTLAVPPGMGTTFNSVNLGKEPTGAFGAFVDGQIDDVRVFTGALPCE